MCLVPEGCVFQQTSCMHDTCQHPTQLLPDEGIYSSAVSCDGGVCSHNADGSIAGQQGVQLVACGGAICCWGRFACPAKQQQLAHSLLSHQPGSNQQAEGTGAACDEDAA